MRSIFSKLSATALLLAASISCSANIEIYGHRGAAGLAPENTIVGYRTALMVGVDVVDLDVGITADGVVVVTHDFRINPEITRLQSVWLKDTGPAIKDTSYQTLMNYDVGRLAPNSYYQQRFPNRVGVDKVRIPTLKEVVQYVKEYAQTPVRFQVELKTTPVKDPSSPDTERLVKAVLAVLKEEKILEQTELQSFDWNALLLAKKLEPASTLSFVTSETQDFNNVRSGEFGDKSWTAGHTLTEYKGSLPKMLASLGASVWNPYYQDLSAERLKEAHDLGLRVVPWSVDNEADMKRMVELGVDGVITNRPDILRGVLASRGLDLPQPSKIRS